MRNNKRIDWSETLKKYGVPTVFKEQLLRPYFETIDLKEPILDVGCGTGYFSGILCARGYKVSGVDLNSRLESTDQFDFVKADFVSLKMDKKFETILLVNILTTVSYADRLKILKKIKEIKTKEGTVYVVNTNADLVGFDFDLELMSSYKIGDNKIRLKVKLVNGEYIEFDDYVIGKKEMRKMCEAVGLHITEINDFKSKELENAVYEMYLLK